MSSMYVDKMSVIG